MRLAFVIQRYGTEVVGGAEQHCRELARRLARSHEVHVLTTCALDHATWANYYPRGISWEEGVLVRRFTVEESRAPDFNQFLSRVYGVAHSDEEEETWLRKQGPTCPGLISFLGVEGRGYDAVVFYTYLYAPTVLGLPLVAERSVLVPTAHDEPAIYLRLFERVFSLPRHLLFLTPAEKRFVHRRFGNEGIPNLVLGTGVEAPAVASPERFRARYGVKGDYLLYTGRIEAAKGCDRLGDYFLRYRAASGRPISLVLLGKGSMALPERDGIIATGYVSEQDKFDAVAGATLVVAPSPYESLSISSLEAWALGVPVLANGESEVLRDHCLASNAGLLYEDYAEFQACLDLLLGDDALRRGMGRNGREYVARNYIWAAVEARFLQAVGRVAAQAAAMGPA